MRVGMIDTQAIRKRSDTVGSKLDDRGQRPDRNARAEPAMISRV
jgi:hypothetical protein